MQSFLEIILVLQWVPCFIDFHLFCMTLRLHMTLKTWTLSYARNKNIVWVGNISGEKSDWYLWTFLNLCLLQLRSINSYVVRTDNPGMCASKIRGELCELSHMWCGKISFVNPIHLVRTFAGCSCALTKKTKPDLKYTNYKIINTDLKKFRYINHFSYHFYTQTFLFVYSLTFENIHAF